MKYILFLFAILALISCQSKNNNVNEYNCVQIIKVVDSLNANGIKHSVQLDYFTKKYTVTIK